MFFHFYFMIYPSHELPKSLTILENQDWWILGYSGVFWFGQKRFPWTTVPWKLSFNKKCKWKLFFFCLIRWSSTLRAKRGLGNWMAEENWLSFILSGKCLQSARVMETLVHPKFWFWFPCQTKQKKTKRNFFFWKIFLQK